GVPQTPTIDRILEYRTRLDKIATFVEETYIPDLVTAATAFPDYWEVGKGYDNFLSYGVFREEEATGENVRKYLPAGVVIDGKYERFSQQHVSEFVGQSRFSSASGKHPYEGETVPDPKSGYSWLKAPRYQGRPMEVGPLARVVVGYHCPDTKWIKEEVDAVLASVGLGVEKVNSVLGRHLARGLESRWIARRALEWLNEVEVGGPPAKDFDLPEKGQGYGLTEAPRGALGHWLQVEDYKIKKYQCVVPTTWNCSPRDDQGQPGPVEKALERTPVEDPEQPLEAGRVVRSFDPCIACAVH
ncbi:MAG: nickel-dependent hydrogenase large subunit, partial [Planctomycetes bacterium]|nr:nickel-dependent hydrogenase large subunit [Planctomycetota bacterium]